MKLMKKAREEYTRVTNILYPFSGLENLDHEIVSNAARRGTRVHKICEGIIAGLGEFDIDEETWGYVASFKKWWGDGHAVEAMEKRFWCDEREITGQVDMIVYMPQGLAIVDIKTSSRPSKTWPVQGAAYAYLAKKAGYDIQKVYFLHLNKHGKAPKIYEYPTDHEFFLAVYMVFNYFYVKEKKEKNEVSDKSEVSGRAGRRGQEQAQGEAGVCEGKADA